MDVIYEFGVRCGLPPTRQEVAEILGVSRQAVDYRVHKAEAKGYLFVKPRKARWTITIGSSETR